MGCSFNGGVFCVCAVLTPICWDLARRSSAHEVGEIGTSVRALNGCRIRWVARRNGRLSAALSLYHVDPFINFEGRCSEWWRHGRGSGRTLQTSNPDWTQTSIHPLDADKRTRHGLVWRRRYVLQREYSISVKIRSVCASLSKQPDIYVTAWASWTRRGLGCRWVLRPSASNFGVRQSIQSTWPCRCRWTVSGRRKLRISLELVRRMNATGSLPAEPFLRASKTRLSTALNYRTVFTPGLL